MARSQNRAEAARRKGNASFTNLLAPVKIGDVELKNRIAVAPMQEYMSGYNGEVTEQTLAYIGARAKGGAGLVISGVFLGTRLAARFPLGRSMVLYHPAHQIGPTLYAERIHYFGAAACAQFLPSLGRQCTPYDPQAVVPAPTAGLPYEMAREKAFDTLAATLTMDPRSRMLATGPMT
ncbi:MAG: hypothetical protein AB1640_19195, partial [bacterium]